MKLIKKTCTPWTKSVEDRLRKQIVYCCYLPSSKSCNVHLIESIFIHEFLSAEWNSVNSPWLIRNNDDELYMHLFTHSYVKEHVLVLTQPCDAREWYCFYFSTPRSERCWTRTSSCENASMNAEISDEDSTLVSLQHTFSCISLQTRIYKSFKWKLCVLMRSSMYQSNVQNLWCSTWVLCYIGAIQTKIKCAWPPIPDSIESFN